MVEEDNMKKAEDSSEPSTKAHLSENETPKPADKKETKNSLEAVSNVDKKSLTNASAETKKGKGLLQVQGKKLKRKRSTLLKGKNKSVKTEEGGSVKPNSTDQNQVKVVQKPVQEINQTQQSQEVEKSTQEKEKDKEEKKPTQEKENNKQEKKDDNVSGKVVKNRRRRGKNKKKREMPGGSSQGKQKEMHEKSDNSQKGKRKDEKKEKLGGLIFLCSAKTKPDCFRYQVMGVSASKKDLVLGIRPGLKLFLYDYDLKLMYGIYKASSSGGMKLEPKAFGGSFPVQVRFQILKDCHPLPESVFKKALKENYTSKHKFKTELSFEQVKKLIKLFRPARVRTAGTGLSVRSPPRQEGGRESRRYKQREPYSRDPYPNGDDRVYALVPHERGRRILYQEPHREEILPQLYPSEKEYRVYGLQGDRRNLTQYTAPVEPYTDPERGHLLRRTDPLYRNSAPGHGDSLRVDPLYLNDREYRTFNVGARQEMLPQASSAAAVTPTGVALNPYGRDPYYVYNHGSSYIDPYLAPGTRGEISGVGRRDGYLVETEPLQSRETEPVDRSYSAYASDPLLDHNLRQHYQVARPEAAVPVSSRYAFAGPSQAYR